MPPEDRRVNDDRLNRIEDKHLAKLLETPALARYAPWLRDLRAFRPHQLRHAARVRTFRPADANPALFGRGQINIVHAGAVAADHF